MGPSAVIASLLIKLGVDPSGVTSGVSQAQGSIAGLGKTVKATDLVMGAAAGALAGGLLSTLGAAREWETAFAGVRKTLDTTGLTAEQETRAFGQLEDELRSLAKTIPISTTELAGLAEAAGALGVAREDVTEFARVTALIGTTTDVAAQEAATSLGKIGTVIGLTADDYEHFGSTLVDLGNQGASFESEILAISNRLSGTAKMVGLSAQEMLGWSAAMANVGILAEAGGSSFQRFAVTVQKAALMGGKHLDALATVTGMSAQAFADLFGRDSNAALKAVIAGLAGMDDAARLTAQGMLGLDDIRINDFISKLTGNVDNLTDSLDLASDAWADNNAMAIEAEKRFATTDSKVQLFWNRVNDLSITLGDALVPVLTSIVEHVGSLVDIIGSAAKAFPAVTAVVTPLVTALSGLMALRFGARFLGLGALEVALSRGLGRVWTRVAAGTLEAAAAAGARAGAAYAGAVGAGGLIGAVATAVGAMAPLAIPVTVAVTLAELTKGLGDANKQDVANQASSYISAFSNRWDKEVDTFEERHGGRPPFRFPWEAGGLFGGPETTRFIDKATDEMRASVLSGVEKLGAGLASITVPAPRIDEPLKAEFAAARQAIREGFGSIKEALRNPPQIISREARLDNMAARMTKVMRNLNKAVKADDPFNVPYWQKARDKLQVQIEKMSGDAKRETGKGARGVKRNAEKAGAAFPDELRENRPKAVTAAEAMATAVEQPLESAATAALASGAHLGANLAAGISSQVGAVAAAADQLAAAAAGPIKFSSPPRRGPLSSIRSWGPHMVDAWVGPVARKIAEVEAMGDRLGAAMRPAFAPVPIGVDRMRFAGPALGAGLDAARARVVVNNYHIGTLIADDGGIDALDRRIAKRRRMKARSNNDLNSAD